MFFRRKKAVRSAGEIVEKLFNKHISKQLGLDLALMAQWSDIVGEPLAEQTEPLRIIWPRKADRGQGAEAGCLIVAATRFAALRLVHKTDFIINRINSFFGYCAIARIKVEQKPVSHKADTALPVHDQALCKEKKRVLEELLRDIKDEDLRSSLKSLGTSIFKQYEKTL